MLRGLYVEKQGALFVSTGWGWGCWRKMAGGYMTMFASLLLAMCWGLVPLASTIQGWPKTLEEEVQDEFQRVQLKKKCPNIKESFCGVCNIKTKTTASENTASLRRLCFSCLKDNFDKRTFLGDPKNFDPQFNEIVPKSFYQWKAWINRIKPLIQASASC